MAAMLQVVFANAFLEQDSLYFDENFIDFFTQASENMYVFQPQYFMPGIITESPLYAFKKIIFERISNMPIMTYSTCVFRQYV